MASDYERELTEEDLIGVSAGYDPRLRAIEEELITARKNGTLTPEQERRLMEDWNKIQGNDLATGHNR